MISQIPCKQSIRIEKSGWFKHYFPGATQLRTNVATVASRWRHCDDLADPAIEPHTFRIDRAGLATELIGRHNATQVCSTTILFV